MSEYFSKSVAIGNTGISATAWAIVAGTFQLTPGTPGVSYGVTVVGFATPEVLASGGQPIPSASLGYNLTLADFPPGTDPNSMSLALLYEGVQTVANADPLDSLNGATLVVA
jgi:hypothetical protein